MAPKLLAAVAEVGLAWFIASVTTVGAMFAFVVISLSLWFMVVFAWAFFDGGFLLFKFHEVAQDAARNIGAVWPVFVVVGAVIGGLALFFAPEKAFR